MNRKLTSLCEANLTNYRVEDGYIKGFLEGDDEAYEKFFKLLNTQCSGFIKRSSGTQNYRNFVTTITTHFLLATYRGVALKFLNILVILGP